VQLSHTCERAALKTLHSCSREIHNPPKTTPYWSFDRRACSRCSLKYEANPQIGTYEDYVTFARSKANVKKISEQDERLDKAGTTALDLAGEQVYSDMVCEWEVNTHRGIYDSTLFMNEKGCSMENIKRKVNASLPANERLTEEEVLAEKPWKREMVTRVKWSTLHRTENIKALLRSKQGADVFKAVAQAMVDDVPWGGSKDHHRETHLEIDQAAQQYLAKIEQNLMNEPEPAEGEEDGENEEADTSSEESVRGLGVGTGKTLANFKPVKKVNKNKAGTKPRKSTNSGAPPGFRQSKPIFGSPKRRGSARKDDRHNCSDLLDDVVPEEPPEAEEEDGRSTASGVTAATGVTTSGGGAEQHIYNYYDVMDGKVPLAQVNIVSALAVACCQERVWLTTPGALER